MLNWFNEKFGTAVIMVIIGGIALVFVFFGVYSPRNNRGDGAVAGTVNGDSISLTEFNREYNRRLEMFKSMAGGKISDEQLKAFHIKEGVFEGLVQRKLMLQEAVKQGMTASDEEVKTRIEEMPAFQKDGRFDLTSYKEVLGANGYSPGAFERLMREDLSSQKWQDYFKDRVHVSDDEIKDAFLVSQDRRDIKYVLLTAESGKKGIQIKPAEVTQFLATPAKLNLIKSQFESRKSTEFKGKNFDDVKETLARDVLAGDQIAQIQKINQDLATEVQKILSADKKMDGKVNALLKPYGVEVKSTGWVSRENAYLPGIGESKSLLDDAFSSKSPILATQGGKAKIYPSVAGTVIAVVTASQSPDLSQLPAKRDDLLRKLSYQKERELSDAWMKKVQSSAKIDPNPSIFSSDAG